MPDASEQRAVPPGSPSASPEGPVAVLPVAAQAIAAQEHFRRTRARSLAIAEPLSAEDCAIQTLADVSPTKWHLAHTSWYFETFVLEPGLAGYAPFDPDFRVLFNSYYNLVGGQHPRPRRGLLSRPGLDEILVYRQHVDRHVERWLERARPGPELDVFVLGVHHEEQHQELMLTDLKHVLASHPQPQVYRELPLAPESTTKPLTWHRYPEGLIEIGAAAGGGFHFDCEGPRHRRWLDGFELGSRLVTSGEFLAFIEAGGYSLPELWLADGWLHAQREGWQAPLYWERDGSGWAERTLGGRRPLRLDLPVAHVSYYEADAFARWFGARLPDEAEWEVAAAPLPVEGHFLGDALEPRSLPKGASPEQPAQLFGDAWEWTRSPFGPYPGYVPPPGAVGEYNGKFMCSQMALRGGSCFTPPGHVRATYRSFFYPHQRWQVTGIRLARDGR